MAIENNLLSLEEWRLELGYNPWHFWGIAGPKVPITSSCNSVVKKHSWQSADAVGREDIARGICNCENRIMPLLGYAPAPHYASAKLPFPHYPDEHINKLGYTGGDARWIGLRLPEGNVREIGVEKITSLGDVALVYTDEDNDGIIDTFTGSVATTETDTSKIFIYFSSTERLDDEGISDKWMIRPIKVKISGGLATFTGRSWLTTYPYMHEGYNNDALDVDNMDIYVTTVEVAIKETNPDGTTYDDCQGLLVWETRPYPSWDGYLTLDPASVYYAIARVGIRKAETGEVYLGESVYNVSTSQWVGVPWFDSAYRYQPPDYVIIRYLAGAPLGNDNCMNTDMKRIDFRLSAAEIQRRICACDTANRNLYHWQFDLSRTGGAGGETYAMMSQADLANPLGTLRGQVMAWKDIKDRRVLGGFSP